ncbi:MAG: orotidine-5'-phosphate decarboxylase [Acidimicrobiales bacterium]
MSLDSQQQSTRQPGPDVRERLALALDVEELSAALQLARRLQPWFGVAKVGLELFTAAGPEAVESLVNEGFSVFLDLKLHDIANTVERAAARARSLGATYLTVHAVGGEAMLRAAVEGFGGGPGGVLAVTVLTSERDAPPAKVAERSVLAERAGCTGVVCAASDLATVTSSVPALIPVVPGIRLAGAACDDQARVATAGAAVAAGAKLLVIGRTVTAAPDPEAAAAEVKEQVSLAIS